MEKASRPGDDRGATHFLWPRFELCNGHYGNNRSRISPAINSGYSISRIFTGVAATFGQTRRRGRLPRMSLGNRKPGRVSKSRKIESETPWCGLAVQLERDDKDREMREERKKKRERNNERENERGKNESKTEMGERNGGK